MKKQFFIIIILLFILISCTLNQEEQEDFSYTPPPYVSFEEVSTPYLQKYGPPEEVNEYTSSDYHSIDWWWWSKGFMVSFLDTTYDDVNGWTVDHTYSFEPFYLCLWDNFEIKITRYNFNYDLC